MRKVRMLHPSSGRDNFDTVSNQATTNTGTGQDGGQTVDKKEIEDKTKDAIKAAIAPQSQTPSGSANKTA